MLITGRELTGKLGPGYSRTGQPSSWPLIQITGIPANNLSMQTFECIQVVVVNGGLGGPNSPLHCLNLGYAMGLRIILIPCQTFNGIRQISLHNLFDSNKLLTFLVKSIDNYNCRRGVDPELCSLSLEIF